MIKILFYTDLHAADQTPRSRTGSYSEDILAKLTEIMSLAQKYDVDYLINGADTFDRKSPWRVSHRLVHRMIEIMRPFPGDRHLTVIGTHDVPTGQLWKLPQQPLGVLQEAGVISVHEKGWIWDKQRNVAFHFVSAAYDLDDDPKNYEIHLDGMDETPLWLITIAHGMIVPPGATFFASYTDVNTIHTDADMVLYGHPHTPDGIYQNTDGTIFVGPGSVSRRDASPYNRQRVPQVVLIGLPEGGDPKFKMIPLESARDPESVFADLIKDEIDENQTAERVAAFVDSLKTANISEDAWGREDLLRELYECEFPDRVKKLAERILDEVG